ncbi:C13 family peptidase [Vibrio campbellii]|uniref:C13 family peptidase n=1 Tax=Vibrio campbellii TaxID=680 RepID=UPI0005F05B3D|nr:C13 family peptidase [Vibrio campbellii]
MKKYALLVAGRSELRHWNDLECCYRTLTNECNIPPQNIFVLYYNGAMHFDLMDFKYLHSAPLYYQDNTRLTIDIRGEATPQTLKQTFSKLGLMLSSEDMLYVMTSGHGSRRELHLSEEVEEPSAESELSCALKHPAIGAELFGHLLGQLSSYHSLVVVMGQCYSGGFQDSVMTHSTATTTLFSAACEADKESAGDEHFTPFLHYWMTSLASAPLSEPKVHHQYAVSHTLRFDSPVIRVSTKQATLENE